MHLDPRSRRFLLPFVLTLGLTPLAAPLFATETNPSNRKEIEARIDRIVSDLAPAVILEGVEPESTTLAARMEELGVPGVSIAVIHKGAIEWARGFGWADVESKRAVTESTRFQAASISKPVAAMAALALVEAGELELEGDVNAHLGDWKIASTRYTRKSPVTLRGLLSHTAGLTVHGFPGYGRTQEAPGTVGVLDGSGNTPAVKVDMTPGSRWRYSGGGYTVMQAMVEHVTGEPFATVLHRTVLAPLGMTASTFEQPLPESLSEVAATAYDSKRSPIEGAWHVYPEQAAAGLWTTPTDLARWLLAIQKARAGSEHPVLSGEMIGKMLAPGPGDWGLGPSIQFDRTAFGHAGGNMGFRCNMVASLDGGTGVVIMTNSDRGGALLRDVLFTIAREYDWPAPKPTRRKLAEFDAETLDAIAGAYRGGPGMLTIEAKDGKLFVTASWDEDPDPVELYAESRAALFPRDGDFRFDLVWKEGAVTALRAGGTEFKRVDKGS